MTHPDGGHVSLRPRWIAIPPRPGPDMRPQASGPFGQSRARRNAAVPMSVHDVASAPGMPLEASVREPFERALGHDLSLVRIHSDARAARSAALVGANAYTVGHDIAFNAGRFNPGTADGDRLLAHELMHVAQEQQSAAPAAGLTLGSPTDPAEVEARAFAARLGSARPLFGGTTTVTQPRAAVHASVLRDCADADFCTPYPTAAEAASAEANLRRFYLPAEGTKFGSESRDLYERYLSRRTGDSLTPVLFDSPSSQVVSSFAESGATADDQDEIIGLIGARLSRAPGPLSDDVPTTMSVENFLSRAELDNRPINYSNPFSIAGHIAGGIGSSDAGATTARSNGETRR